jgi:hypothetical protein
LFFPDVSTLLIAEVFSRQLTAPAVCVTATYSPIRRLRHLKLAPKRWKGKRR